MEMCVDFRDLDKACPKDHYPLSRIDQLVDSTSGYELLSFMDAYQGYHQILLAKNNEDKASFITSGRTFCYVVMPFGLKNARATYQRLMNKLFKKQLDRNVEVLWKTQKFGWDEKCEQAFRNLKSHLAELPVLVKPEPREKLFVYLSTTEYDSSRKDYDSFRSICDDDQVDSGDRRMAIKAQALSDFLLEIVQPDEEEVWRVTNNEAEYEAVLVGIRAAREVRASRIILYSDSQLITQQIKGIYEAKDDIMLKYLKLIQAQAKVFVYWMIEQIPRDENGEADAFAKMVTSLSEVSTREVLHIFRLILSTEEETLPAPEDSWMTPMIKFIVTNEFPEDKARAQKIERQALRFVFLDNILYRRSFQGPLLKCLSMGEVDHVLREIHERCCGEHLGGLALARKALLAEFWWPTIGQDSAQVCGMNIFGPFLVSWAQKKFLLVAVVIFSKWVEAEPLARTTEQEVLKFLWKDIVCRFGVPRRLISDNEKQFQGKEITAWCQEMKITQYFTSVVYPQANGQTERFYTSIILLSTGILFSPWLNIPTIYFKRTRKPPGVSDWGGEEVRALPLPLSFFRAREGTEDEGLDFLVYGFLEDWAKRRGGGEGGSESECIAVDS
ncbi:uncharacterized protein [Primulina eburnea]|uniref:uncharacterized protein n=1 Tax=Primulina eburnea TaxID=1245227 RepID=UPI003C6C7E92